MFSVLPFRCLYYYLVRLFVLISNFCRVSFQIIYIILYSFFHFIIISTSLLLLLIVSFSIFPVHLHYLVRLFILICNFCRVSFQTIYIILSISNFISSWHQCLYKTLTLPRLRIFPPFLVYHVLFKHEHYHIYIIFSVSFTLSLFFINGFLKQTLQHLRPFLYKHEHYYIYIILSISFILSSVSINVFLKQTLSFLRPFLYKHEHHHIYYFCSGCICNSHLSEAAAEGNF